MKEEEQDMLIIETHNDVKWIKDWATEHKKTHRSYLYYFITACVAVVISWFKS